MAALKNYNARSSWSGFTRIKNTENFQFETFDDIKNFILAYIDNGGNNFLNGPEGIIEDIKNKFKSNILGKVKISDTASLLSLKGDGSILNNENGDAYYEAFKNDKREPPEATNFEILKCINNYMRQGMGEEYNSIENEEKQKEYLWDHLAELTEDKFIEDYLKTDYKAREKFEQIAENIKKLHGPIDYHAQAKAVMEEFKNNHLTGFVAIKQFDTLIKKVEKLHGSSDYGTEVKAIMDQFKQDYLTGFAAIKEFNALSKEIEDLHKPATVVEKSNAKKISAVAELIHVAMSTANGYDKPDRIAAGSTIAAKSILSCNCGIDWSKVNVDYEFDFVNVANKNSKLVCKKEPGVALTILYEENIYKGKTKNGITTWEADKYTIKFAETGVLGRPGNIHYIETNKKFYQLDETRHQFVEIKQDKRTGAWSRQKNKDGKDVILGDILCAVNGNRISVTTGLSNPLPTWIPTDLSEIKPNSKVTLLKEYTTAQDIKVGKTDDVKADSKFKPGTRNTAQIQFLSNDLSKKIKAYQETTGFNKPLFKNADDFIKNRDNLERVLRRNLKDEDLDDEEIKKEVERIMAHGAGITPGMLLPNDLMKKLGEFLGKALGLFILNSNTLTASQQNSFNTLCVFTGTLACESQTFFNSLNDGLKIQFKDQKMTSHANMQYGKAVQLVNTAEQRINRTVADYKQLTGIVKN